MLKPLGDRVILEVNEDKEQMVGGIVLADNAKEKSQTGTVVAVGNGSILENGEKKQIAVKVGDDVLYDKYAGTEVSYDNGKYLIIQEKDLLAVKD